MQHKHLTINNKTMKIGILTSGGDCPGINATIRGVSKAAINCYGMEVVGIHGGFQGLLDIDTEPLTSMSVSGLLTSGGTILGTSREKPFKKKATDEEKNERKRLITDNVKKMGLDAIVCIGGNGTQKSAYKLSKIGLNIVSIPKTIDNDVWGTDQTFGFDTAVGIATEAIDRLHSTASSHRRVMVIEVMGHKAGWIALHSGIAGGGDIILLPELDYDIKTISRVIMDRFKKGHTHTIVVVAEGIKTMNGRKAGEFVAQQIEFETGIETRQTVLGYVQRGGSPSTYDRILATRMGAHAADLIARKDFGKMVCLRGDKISSISLEDVNDRLKLVTEDNDLVVQGRRIGICFGK